MIIGFAVVICLSVASGSAAARDPVVTPASTAGATDRTTFPNAEALVRYAGGRLAQERGEDADAMSEYLRVLAIDSRSHSALLNVSELAARRGEAARSLEFAERALVQDPGDAQSLWLKGSAQFNLGRPQAALETLEAATRADSTQTQYLLTLARVAETMDRIPVVARTYRNMVDLDEDDAEAWFQLAAAEARLGHFGAADSALTRSIDLNPMRPGQIFLKGWIRESTGRREEAIALYRDHLELHPDDHATRGRLVEQLALEQRFAEAYAESKRLTRARPGDLDALEREADLAYKLERPGEGAAALERMRRAAPDDPATVVRALGVLAHHGRGSDAIAMADAWARAHPDDYRGEMVVAQANAIEHRMDAAVVHARRAIAAVPDSLGPRVMLGRMFQGEKRYAEAEPVWAEALARFPRVPGLGLDLAFCREKLGNLDGAESAARDVLKHEPDNPSALNFLGYLLADHNRMLEEAEGLIRRAVEQDPDNGAFLDSFGWVYYRLGKLKEARLQLERAASLAGDSVIHEHLGDVYKDLQLLNLAREQYSRAVERDSTNTRARSKLAEIR